MSAPEELRGRWGPECGHGCFGGFGRRGRPSCSGTELEMQPPLSGALISPRGAGVSCMPYLSMLAVHWHASSACRCSSKAATPTPSAAPLSTLAWGPLWVPCISGSPHLRFPASRVLGRSTGDVRIKAFAKRSVSVIFYPYCYHLSSHHRGLCII